MKTLFAIFLISFLSIQSFAAKSYTLNDYRKYTRGGAVKVSVASSSKAELNYYGQNCAYAALASVIAGSFKIAEEKGVDYPEVIEINDVRVSSPTNWVYMLLLTSGKYIFNTRLTINGANCSADESTISTKVTNLGSLHTVK